MSRAQALSSISHNADSNQRRETSKDGKKYIMQQEGEVEILLPLSSTAKIENLQGKSALSNLSTGAEEAKQVVFYNPIQQFNRDLSVLAIKAFAQDTAARQLEKEEKKGSNSVRRRDRGRKRKRDESDAHAVPSEKGNDRLTIETVDYYGGLDTNQREENAVDPELLGGDQDKPTRKPEDSQTPASQAKMGSKEENSAPTQKHQRLVSTENPDPRDLNVRKKTIKGSDSSKFQFKVLDALSASGLRALRYAKEIPLVSSVNANDVSSSATDSIKLNMAHNKLNEKISTSTAGAIEHMQEAASPLHGPPRYYNVIDLDPYGTAAPFFDAAVRALADGGLLCITCTDAGVFASMGYLEKTFSLYGGLPMKGSQSHEGGLRLILNAIATSAARYGFAIEPLLSLSIDFYARVFVRVRRSPLDVKFLASKIMYVYNCDSGCGAWDIQFLAQARAREARNGETVFKFTAALGPNTEKECEHCGFRMHLAGPMWGGALHNPFFIKNILDMLPSLDPSIYGTVPRLEGMLSTALEECLDDPWASRPTSRRPPKSPSKLGKLPGSPLQVGSITDENPSTAPENEQSGAAIAQGRIPEIPPEYRAMHPFFIHPPVLARTLNTPTPADAQLRGALRHLGYRTARSHTRAGSIVTDAPWSVIWEIMREWARKEGLQIKSKPGTAAWRLMQQDRSRADLEIMKKEVNEKVKKAQTIEELKTELEAGLGRLSSSLLNGTNDDNIATSINKEAQDSDQNAPTKSSTSGEPPKSPDSTSYKKKPLPPHTLQIQFDEELGKKESSIWLETSGGDGKEGRTQKKLRRYQMNPANWGPRGKATG